MRSTAFAFLLTAGLLSGQIRLSTQELSVELSPGVGFGLTRMRDVPSGRDYISAETKLPLYRLILSSADGTETEITSAQAASVSPQTGPDSAVLTFEHPDQNMTVTCTVRIATSPGRVVWKIAIQNKGRRGVRSLFYPQWAAPTHLPSGENRLLFPYLDGQEFVDPGKYFAERSTKRIAYPGQAAMQMLAYHDAEAGMVGMTLDGEGWVKHVRVGRIAGALDLSFEHNPDERPGTNIDLPYQTVFSLSGATGTMQLTSIGSGRSNKSGLDRP